MEGTKWSKAVGQSSLLRVDWKSFDEELPKFGEDIVVIFKFKDGYGPLHAEYICDGTENSAWKEVRFREPFIGPIYSGSKQWKDMIAWGRFKVVIELTKECPVCKNLQCQC